MLLVAVGSGSGLPSSALANQFLLVDMKHSGTGAPGQERHHGYSFRLKKKNSGML